MTIDELLNAPWTMFILALGAAAVALTLVMRARRRNKEVANGTSEDQKAAANRRDKKIITALVLTSYAMSTYTSAGAMLRFFHEILNADPVSSAIGFAIFEVAMFGMAIGARFNRRNGGGSGHFGWLIWAFAGATGFFASLDAHSGPEFVFRYAPPIVAATMWEIYLKMERAIAEIGQAGEPKHRRSMFAIVRDRIYVKLGFGGDNLTVSEMAIARRLTKIAKTAAAYHTTEWTVRRAWLKRRHNRHIYLANRSFGYANDPCARATVVAQISMLYNALDWTSPEAINRLGLNPFENLPSADHAPRRTPEAPKPRPEVGKHNPKPNPKPNPIETADNDGEPTLSDPIREPVVHSIKGQPMTAAAIEATRATLMMIAEKFEVTDWVEFVRDVNDPNGRTSLKKVRDETGFSHDRVKAALHVAPKLFPNVPDNIAELDENPA